MATSAEGLKFRLSEVGSKLENPPTSVKELLVLLDRVEVYLSLVEQSPSKDIQNVLAPTLKALINDELLRHVDDDVKVAVASCLIEITRITAPEIPYDDEKMQEAFQLIISSFERLDDNTSQSFSKRTNILETFSRVRLCVVMLDLEFDDLILEMFQHFIKAIRDYHSENVVNCMEDIMIRCIEESEVISSDLLFCILEAVRKDNEDVLPVACKLMKKVIGTCADKLRPCIKMSVIAKGISLADYGDVVNDLCDAISAERVIQSEQSSASALRSAKYASKSSEPLDDTVQTAAETPIDAVNITENISTGGFTNLLTKNGDTCTKDDSEGTETDTKASVPLNEKPFAVTTEEKLDTGKENEKTSETEALTNTIIRKQGRKTKAKNGKKKSSEPKLDESNKDVCTSPHQESSNEAVEHVSFKPSGNDAVPSGETTDSAHMFDVCSKSKMLVSSPKNHTSLDNKTITSAVTDLQEGAANLTVDASRAEASAYIIDLPLKKNDASVAENLKKDLAVLSSDSVQDATAPTLDVPVVEIESGIEKHAHEVEHNLPKAKDKRKLRRRSPGKAAQQNHAVASENINKESTTTQMSATKSVQERKILKETPKTTTKRKRIEENKNEEKDYGKELVGSKVKVWWDDDKRYYKGVIESFNSAKKKHKVLYSDGEVEHLILQREKWAILESDEESDMEEKDFGRELVGSKVKVWWPDDKRYYRGAIESFNSAKKKHKVVYSDGVVEHLILKKEQWEVIDSDKESDADSDHETPGIASGKRKSGKQVVGGASMKRLERSGKSISASAKLGSKLRYGSKASDAKLKVGEVKATGKSIADVADNSVAQDAQYSGKSKGGESRTSIKRKSISDNSSLPKVETRSAQKQVINNGGKGTKSSNGNPAIKSKANDNTRLVAPTLKSEGKSLSTAKSNAKSDPSDSENTEGAAEEQKQSNVRETRSSKRKEIVLEKEKKGEPKLEKKRKKGRRY